MRTLNALTHERCMSTLEDAIERLYAAFQDVPRPHHVEGCPCCIDTKRIPQLLATPLRQIPPDALASYASSGLLTVGDVSDYLYFLPRILEISASDDAWWPDIEVTARAIRSTELKSWPAKRSESLTSFFQAVIENAIASGDYFRLDGWLCAMARMDLDVRPCLSRIETKPGAVLEYFEDNAKCLRNDKLCNPFWELPNEGHDAIVQWFTSEAIRKIVFPA
jgi:hypothetical protein